MKDIFKEAGLISKDYALLIVNTIMTSCGNLRGFSATDVLSSNVSRVIYMLDGPFEVNNQRHIVTVKEAFQSHDIDEDIDGLLSRLRLLYTLLMREKYTVDGYKYLTSEINLKAKAAILFNKDAIDPLLKEICGFDFSYRYSDSRRTYNYQSTRERELNERIEASDYSPAQQTVLRKALLVGHKVLLEDFPQVRLLFTSKDEMDLVDIINTGKYDEERIDKLIALLSPISKVLINQTGLYGYYLIKLNRSVSIDTYDISHRRLALSTKDQECLNAILDNVTVEDLKYLQTVWRGVSSYVDEGCSGSPDYTSYNPLSGTLLLKVDGSKDEERLVFHVSNSRELYTFI